LARLTATRSTYLDYLFSIYFGLVSDVAQAQAGAAGSITLAAGSPATNDFFKGQIVVIYTGTGAGQARACYAYNGTTKVALIRPDWAVAPDSTSWYVIISAGSAVVSAMDDIDFGALQKASLNAATPASIVGDVGGNVIGAVASVTAGVTVTTNNDKTGYALSAAAIQAIWDALTSALITVGSIGKKLADWAVGTIDTYTGNTKQTGDNYTRLGTPAGASVSADIAAAKVDTAAILLDTGTDGVVLKAAGLNADAVDEILDEVVEGSVTLRHAIKIFLAALAGKSTGGGTTTLIFRDNADAKARITATVDANGNRTAMTLDGA